MGNLNGNAVSNPLTSLSNRFKFRGTTDNADGGKFNIDSFFWGRLVYLQA